MLFRSLMGINVDKIISLVFLIGPGLGGVAGVMVGLYYGQIDFSMGWVYGLKAFTAAILGGIGNIPGAMLGGLLLGLVETLGAAYLTISCITLREGAFRERHLTR